MILFVVVVVVGIVGLNQDFDVDVSVVGGGLVEKRAFAGRFRLPSSLT